MRSISHFEDITCTAPNVLWVRTGRSSERRPAPKHGTQSWLFAMVSHAQADVHTRLAVFEAVGDARIASVWTPASRI